MIFKSIINLIGGSAVVQLLQFSLFPIVAGMFGPEIISTYGYLLSITAISASLVNLRIENIVMLIDRRRINHIAYTLCLITPLMSLVAAMGNEILQLWRPEKKGDLSVLIYLLILSVNASQCLSLCMIKTSDITKYHLHNFVRVIIAFLFPIILRPYFNNGLYLLILCNILSGAYLGGASILSLPKKNLKFNFKKIKIFIAWMYFSYKRNFTIGIPQGILNAISHNIPNIMFVSFFDPLSSAAFVVLDKMFRTPIGVINNSVRNIVMSVDSRDNGKEIKKIQVGLIAIGLCGVVISFPISRYISSYFGSNWLLAVEYFPWISIWGAGFLANSIGSAFIAKWFDYGNLFFVQAIDTVTRILLIYVSYKFNFGFSVALISYVFVSLIFNVYVCVRGWYLYGKKIESIYEI